MKERPRKPTRSRRQTPSSPSTIPPIIAALFRLAEPDHIGVSRDFIEAYAAMPQILDVYINGDEDRSGALRLDDLIADISGLAKARARAEKDPDIDQTEGRDFEERHDPARIIAILNRINKDYPTDLTAPVGNAGLWVGMAFACYVLTNGGAR